MNTSIKSRRLRRSALALGLLATFAAPSASADCWWRGPDGDRTYWSLLKGAGVDDDEGTSEGDNNETCDSYSVAFGRFNRSSSQFASAFGYDNNAAGNYSNAFGSGNYTFGEGSAAFGTGNLVGTPNTLDPIHAAVQSGIVVWGSAFGTGNHVAASWSNAFGRENLVTGESGNAFGSGNRANATQAVAMGYYNNNTASDGNALPTAGLYSVAVGHRNSASGEGSNAFGSHNRAEGQYSSVFGYDSQAVNLGSTAIGFHAVADRDYVVSVGKSGEEHQIIHLADATADTDAVNLRQLNAAISASEFDPSTIVGAFGGGAAWNAAAGTFIPPKYIIQGVGHNSVGGALSSIDAWINFLYLRSEHAVYYDDFEHTSVTLDGPADGEAGAGGAEAGTGGTQVKNVADAVDPMDAVNKRQMDAGDAATLGKANAYTDTRETAIRSDMAAGDAATLTASKAYTDTKSTQTLNSANAYTDGRFTELNDRFVQFQQETDLRFAHTDRRIDRQGAMGSAMLNMAINASGTQSRAGRVAVGVGWQGGESALSIGYGKRFGKTGSFSLGGAMSHGEKSAGMGVGFDL